MKPIYKPKGRAGEYGDYAINIYTGCNHGCVYCYAARNAKRWGKDFTNPTARSGIVEATKWQLESEKISGKTIHLCFTCDPYPAQPVDTTPTREIIKAIKDSGNHCLLYTSLADSGVWIMAKSGARGYWLTDSLAEMRQFLNEADSRIVAIMQGTAALRIYLARAEGREAVIHVRNYDRRVRIIPSEFEQIRLEV